MLFPNSHSDIVALRVPAGVGTAQRRESPCPPYLSRPSLAQTPPLKTAEQNRTNLNALNTKSPVKHWRSCRPRSRNSLRFKRLNTPYLLAPECTASPAQRHPLFSPTEQNRTNLNALNTRSPVQHWRSCRPRSRNSLFLKRLNTPHLLAPECTASLAQCHPLFSPTEQNRTNLNALNTRSPIKHWRSCRPRSRNSLRFKRLNTPYLLAPECTASLGSMPSAVQSDRTEPNKPERAEQTIPCKTLEIMPPTQQKLLVPQTAEHPASPRPRMHSLAGSTPSAVQSDRTEPNKPERSEHTIPCTTLEIMPPTQQKLLVPQTAEHPASPRPRMHSLAGSTPSAVQSDRTEPNKPERAEHTIPCKTLEIMPLTQQKLLVLQSAEHPPPPCSRVRPRAPQNRPAPNTAEHSRTQPNRTEHLERTIPRRAQRIIPTEAKNRFFPQTGGATRCVARARMDRHPERCKQALSSLP